ncbi:NHL repeat-containing protein [Bdellovibrio sp. HCB-110]|uniref:NHL repeat-containing protein n=1 Tax=Bdellovibrio sp. HCB-110 TaxID=3391182 RepID=UPI0039B3FDA4
MNRGTSLKVFTALCMLFLLGACTINAEMFGGAKDLLSEDPGNQLTLKGQFPLGDPAFSGEFKNYVTAAPGNRFVFATFDDDVYVTTDAGVIIKKFTPPGVTSISGLTVDSNGVIYITGSYDPNPNDTRFIRKFDMDGNYIGEAVTYTDEGGGAVALPENPYVAPDGSIYVSAFSQIRKYNAAGTLQTTYGSVQGTNDGEIQGTHSFSVESDGSVYVADTWSDRLQKFNANGTFNSKFTWPRQVPAPSIVTSLMRESNGDFVLTERMGGDGRITSFDGTGTLKWTRDGTERGSAKYDSNLMSLTKYNGFYYLGYRDSLVLYNVADGTFFKEYKKMLSNPFSVTRNKDGFFFVGAGNGLHKFNAKGEWQLTFGSTSGAMYSGVAVSSDDTVYAIDIVNPGKVFKYDINGNSLGFLAVPTSAAPYGLSIDKNDNLFVADGGGGGLIKIPLATGVPAAFAAGQYTIPAGVSCQPDGTVLIMDFNGAASIGKRFNADGTLADTFGNAGPGTIGGTALGVTADPISGRIYVAHATANKIMVYESNGDYVTDFTNADFNQPFGIYADSAGDIFVADQLNNNVKKFKSDGTMATE